MDHTFDVTSNRSLAKIAKIFLLKFLALIFMSWIHFGVNFGVRCELSIYLFLHVGIPLVPLPFVEKTLKGAFPSRSYCSVLDVLMSRRLYFLIELEEERKRGFLLGHGLIVSKSCYQSLCCLIPILLKWCPQSLSKQ